MTGKDSKKYFPNTDMRMLSTDSCFLASFYRLLLLWYYDQLICLFLYCGYFWMVIY